MDFDRKPIRPLLLWLLAFLSATAFALALTFGLPAVASECSTRSDIARLPALLFLLGGTALGLPVMLGSGRAARSLLFLAAAALIAIHTLVLSEALAMAIETEVRCRTRG